MSQPCPSYTFQNRTKTFHVNSPIQNIMASTTDKTAHSTKQIVSLMNTNLMDVVNERSPAARLATIKSIHTPDFIF